MKVLGETGRNFAAGMSGGVAYVYVLRITFEDVQCIHGRYRTALDASEIDSLRQLVADHLDLTAAQNAAFASTVGQVSRF